MVRKYRWLKTSVVNNLVINSFVKKSFVKLALFTVFLSQAPVSLAVVPLGDQEQIAGQRQVTDQRQVTNKEQDNLLETIDKQFHLKASSSGHFKQKKFVSLLPRPLLSSGEFHIDQESELEWRITEPLESRLVFNSQGIRQQQQGREHWLAKGKHPAVEMTGRIMKAILSNNWQDLETYFTITGSVGDGYWALKLVPKEQFMVKVLQKIKLRGAESLRTMILYEVNGDRTELEFHMNEQATVLEKSDI